jgi:hypothetical protein
MEAVSTEYGLDKDSNIGFWTAYIEKAKPYKTYEEALAVIETLPPDFYQIDKIFKV